MEKVKVQDLEKVLEPLFYHWKRKRQAKESFGDFSNRLVSIIVPCMVFIIFFPILINCFTLLSFFFLFGNVDKPEMFLMPYPNTTLISFRVLSNSRRWSTNGKGYQNHLLVTI